MADYRSGSRGAEGPDVDGSYSILGSPSHMDVDDGFLAVSDDEFTLLKRQLTIDLLNDTSSTVRILTSVVCVAVCLGMT